VGRLLEIVADAGYRTAEDVDLMFDTPTTSTFKPLVFPAPVSRPPDRPRAGGLVRAAGYAPPGRPVDRDR